MNEREILGKKHVQSWEAKVLPAGLRSLLVSGERRVCPIVHSNGIIYKERQHQPRDGVVPFT
jgi:hypothetical protein